MASTTAAAPPKHRPARTPAAPAGDASLRHLLAHLAVLQDRVEALVAARRRHDPSPDDAFRGLYVADEHVDRLLDEGLPPLGEPRLDGAAAAAGDYLAAEGGAPGGDFRLRRLDEAFGLNALDRRLLLCALAPDLDPRFEKLYGYLHDDVTRRRATPGLALELAGCSVMDAPARDRLGPGSPLVRGGLLLVEEQDRPFLTRSLRVPDRVAGHLLGSDEPAGELAPYRREPIDWPNAVADGLGRALGAGVTLAYLRQTGSATAMPVAHSGMLAAGGQPPLCVDLAAAPPEDAEAVARLAVREARLRGIGLVAGPVDGLPAAALRILTAATVPAALFGSGPWDPGWSDTAPLSLIAPELRQSELESVWHQRVSDHGASADVLPETVAAFRLGPEAVGKAVASAAATAAAEGGPLESRHLVTGARLQNGTGLARLARHIVPAVGWDDLVVPPDTREGLEHLVSRVTHRDHVLDSWGLRRGGGRGEAVLALFAGESGTGKTMAAEVVAGELGLEVYVLDLSSVVDKYIGETEKNLERIFTEAASVNAVLFFDEADAIFGKRSEVSDAKDRYANVEISYLLQRLETFDGLAVLATNLRANLDEAFARRLSMVIDFGRPDVAQRQVLWRKSLAAVPLAEDVDLAYCAQAFDLAGGDIRSVAVTAAYSAAALGRIVDMRGLIKAVQLEYRKLGRLCLEAEFGPYYTLLTAASGDVLDGDRPEGNLRR